MATGVTKCMHLSLQKGAAPQWAGAPRLARQQVGVFAKETITWGWQCQVIKIGMCDKNKQKTLPQSISTGEMFCFLWLYDMNTLFMVQNYKHSSH